jgi:NADPH:quinone reductase-like Zn-dependent oxidoreductase
MSLLLHKANKGLNIMVALYESGKFLPMIDRSYPLSEVVDAMHCFSERHAKGKFAIAMVDDS